MELAVVHVDDSLLVLDKPAGLLAVPGRGADKQDCLATRVQAWYPDARVVHRLDMDTSGLMLMARGAVAQRTLNRAFAARAVEKRYLAVVSGSLPAPAAEWGMIELPLACDWPNRPRQIVDPVHGKPSLTRWRVLKHPVDGTGTATRVELEPVTGRSHQLRVHLAAIGHPVLGDPLYAPPTMRAAAPRLLLHAWRLRFAHPLSGEVLEFERAAPF
jgi:tRNA pseudouridine32 synthase/23S rRNA pseudouridine746 synthase